MRYLASRNNVRNLCNYLRQSTSDRNPLDFIECDLVAGPVVELGRARAFVRRHGLGVFKGAAVLKVGRYPRGPESVAADFLRDAGRLGRQHLAKRLDLGERQAALVAPGLG